MRTSEQRFLLLGNKAHGTFFGQKTLLCTYDRSAIALKNFASECKAGISISFGMLAHVNQMGALPMAFVAACCRVDEELDAEGHLRCGLLALLGGAELVAQSR